MTEVEAKDLRARIRELYVEDDTGCTNMEKEFGRLAKEENHPMAFKNASMSCNSTKNRYCNILPCKSRSVLSRVTLCCFLCDCDDDNDCRACANGCLVMLLHASSCLKMLMNMLITKMPIRALDCSINANDIDIDVSSVL